MNRTAPRLILASASPRRRELLARLDVSFTVEAADIDERRVDDETPRAMATRLALCKAQTVRARIRARGDADDASPILAADTVVALGDDVFGKPRSRDDAVAMLRRLSDATHTVFSAVALCTDDVQLQAVSASEVAFRKLDANEIEIYCDSDEPFDKAGGYAIQGGGGAFVQSICGSYSGIIGLPMWEVWRLLRRLESESRRHSKTHP